MENKLDSGEISISIYRSLISAHRHSQSVVGHVHSHTMYALDEDIAIMGRVRSQLMEDDISDTYMPTCAFHVDGRNDLT